MRKLTEKQTLKRLSTYPDLLKKYESGKLSRNKAFKLCGLREHHRKNAKHISEQKKQRYNVTRETDRGRNLLNNAKKRAMQENLPLTIDKDFINCALPQGCPVLGSEFEMGVGKPTHQSATVDKFIPADGYTPENTWIISHKANSIKSDGSTTDVLQVGIWMALAEELKHTIPISAYQRYIPTILLRVREKIEDCVWEIKKKSFLE